MRPTQKAMGQGAVRSQMDTRICFRVRERKDVDLVLGQGMLTVGWHAHTLNAPGKFLVSAPEHTAPKRARAYLVTDDDVARIAVHYGPSRPQLDEVSRTALNHVTAAAEPVPWYRKNPQRVADEPADVPRSRGNPLEEMLWEALQDAPEDGADVAELMRITGLGRTMVHVGQPRPQRLRVHVASGAARRLQTPAASVSREKIRGSRSTTSRK